MDIYGATSYKPESLRRTDSISVTFSREIILQHLRDLEIKSHDPPSFPGTLLPQRLLIK